MIRRANLSKSFQMGFLWTLLSLPLAQAALRVGALELQADFKRVSPVLTTEKVRTLDPGEVNPHLQRGVVNRRVELMGLKADSLENSMWGVSATGIQSVAQGYLRGAGPWYRPLSEFSCEVQPNAGFGTAEGTEIAVSTAGVLWGDFLKENKAKLEILLSRVKGPSEGIALDRAEGVFRQWLRDVERQWRILAKRQARKKEWAFYWAEAKTAGLCKDKKERPVEAIRWSRMMEPLKADSPETGPASPRITDLLARAPARLWNGLFSVRVSVEVGGKVLNGRFLIDSGVETSLISPSWLMGQGVYQSLTIMPGLPPERVIHHGTLWDREVNTEGTSSLARRG